MQLENKNINKYYFTFTLKIFLNYGKIIFLKYTTVEHDFIIKVVKNN